MEIYRKEMDSSCPAFQGHSRLMEPTESYQLPNTHDFLLVIHTAIINDLWAYHVTFPIYQVISNFSQKLHPMHLMPLLRGICHEIS